MFIAININLITFFYIVQIQTATNTKLSFLIPILVKTEEMVIHVIGEKILDRELRFPVSKTYLV